MIRNTIKLAAIAAVSLAFGGQAFAQTQASGTATATIERAPISVAKAANKDLALGTIIKPTSGTNTATVSASGTCAVAMSGGGNATGTGGSCAEFTITGENSTAYTLSFAAATVPLNGPNSSTLTLTLNKSTEPTITNNTATVKVGGSIPISTSTVIGQYSGDFAVTVAYN